MTDKTMKEKTNKKPSKYQTILSHLKEAIQDGRLESGQKLPSIRQLSQDFATSKDTVVRALLELKHQELVYAKPQSGYYVLAGKESQAYKVPLKNQQEQIFQDFQSCLHDSLDANQTYLYNPSSQQASLPQLQEAVQDLLADQAIYSPAKNILFTSGTQQSLYLLAQISFPNQGQEILVEQPTYHRMNRLLQEGNFPYQTIERSPQGIDLQELEAIFSQGKTKFFYTIPRFHYPLGHSYSKEEKLAILALAHRYDVYLIEDDYLADFDRNKQVSFHYLDKKDCVIYLKSFSTVLFPALRITAIILPEAIRKPFLHYRHLMDYDSNLIMQKALALYIQNKLYHRNLARLLEQTRQQDERWAQRLNDSQLPWPHQLIHNGLLLDLRHQKKISALKHSTLPLDFFPEAYIEQAPDHYAKVHWEDLEDFLDKTRKK